MEQKQNNMTWEEIENKIKSYSNIGLCLQLCITVAFLYIFFRTNVITTHFSSLGSGFWFMSIPLCITTIILAVVSALFQRGSEKGYIIAALLLILIVIIVYVIGVQMLIIKGFFRLLIVNVIVSIPSFIILAKCENKETRLRKIAEQGEADFQFKFGVWYINQNKMEKAFEWLEKSSAQGCYEAKAKLCDYGIDFFNSGNYDEALKWIVTSIAHGYLKAQAKLYDFGVKLFNSADYDEALKWLGKASEQGDPNAHNKLYEYGVELFYSGNYSKALKWLGKVSEQGNADLHKMEKECKKKIAQKRKENKRRRDAEEAEREKVRANREENLSTENGLKMLSESGDAEAQFLLGSKYLDNNNVREAIYWLEKSGEQGYGFAQDCLHLCYLYGIVVDKNPYQAEYWGAKADECDKTGYSPDLLKQPKCVRVAILYLHKIGRLHG